MSEHEQQTEEGREYPGNLTRWRTLHDTVIEDGEGADVDRICLTIEKGFEGLALVLTQIRFDLKGRS